MAPSILFDLSTIDLNAVVVDVAGIEKVNPHRGVMRMLDGIVYNDHNEPVTAIAYREIGDDEFWVPGHIPGRPIFPGVLMVEAAAQLASFQTISKYPHLTFLGFAGIEDVKFRGQVVPGDRLYILSRQIELRERRSICQTQGVVNGKLVFEARIIGMPL